MEHSAHSHPTPDTPDIFTCPMHPEVRQSAPGSCPKCGMTLVSEQAAALHAQCHGQGHGPGHGGTDEPGGKYDSVPAGWTGSVYTCPMHPQVRQTDPGSCPLCGMGLELDSVASADEAPTRNWWISPAGSGWARC